MNMRPKCTAQPKRSPNRGAVRFAVGVEELIERLVRQREQSPRQVGGGVAGAEVAEVDDSDELAVAHDQVGRVWIAVDPLGRGGPQWRLE